eukprot:scaffold49337_cov60-Phaeocystis_antarctica.AAC.1
MPKYRASTRTCSSRWSGGVPTKRQPPSAGSRGPKRMPRGPCRRTLPSHGRRNELRVGCRTERFQLGSEQRATNVEPDDLLTPRHSEGHRRGPRCDRWADSRNALVAANVERRGAADRREPGQPE